MSYKIAITSSDGVNIDQHFGCAEQFYVIEVDEKSGKWNTLEIRRIKKNESNVLNSNSCCGAHNDIFLKSVSDELSDCIYLLTEKVGKYPHFFLQRNGISALEGPEKIETAILKLNKYYTRK